MASLSTFLSSPFCHGKYSILSTIPNMAVSRPKSKRRPSAFNMDAFFQNNKKQTDLSKMQSDKANIGAEDFVMSDRDGVSIAKESVQTVSIKIVSSILQVSPEDWDACALDALGKEEFNPFLSHGFLSSLEMTRCAVQETGWLPCHLVAADDNGAVLGVVPLYIKSHSYGEFVFDHSWADAYDRYGSSYYPKLQCCVPFTPVTGNRILVRDIAYKDQIFEKLLTAMMELTENLQASSLHITFLTEIESQKLKQFGFLQRIGMQYHWKNRGYKSFDDFLMDLKQSKRATIRKERKKIVAQSLTMRRLRGYEIKPHHWDIFYNFYRNTTDNKWGHAYLTREFFHMMSSKLDDRVMLVTAEDGGEVVAGALNLIGGNSLFGRLWGCHSESFYPNLHFEACYYQAIEAAIEWNLQRVEAGAQGEHKVQRGYMPVTTYSCHYIPERSFNHAIASFLRQETAQVRVVMDLLAASGPFKEESD